MWWWFEGGALHHWVFPPSACLPAAWRPGSRLAAAQNEKKSILIEIFNPAWNVQSRLKISILTFRIPHKKWGSGGRRAWNFQSKSLKTYQSILICFFQSLGPYIERWFRHACLLSKGAFSPSKIILKGSPDPEMFGKGGRRAWNFQSHLKISRSWINSIFGPLGFGGSGKHLALLSLVLQTAGQKDGFGRFWRFRRLWRFRSRQLPPLNSTPLFRHPEPRRKRSETKNQPKDRSFRPDVPADIRPKTSVRPSKSWKNKHFGTDMPRGRPRKNFGLKNFGLIFRSLLLREIQESWFRSSWWWVRHGNMKAVTPFWAGFVLFLVREGLSAPHRCVVRCALRWPSRVASGNIAALWLLANFLLFCTVNHCGERKNGSKGRRAMCAM